MHNFEEISMWKKIIICSFIIAIILIFICIKISIPDNSDNIIIGVKDIIITNITETNPTYETIFNVYDWDDELREEVRKDKDSYLLVSINYIVKNNSENIEMKDIRFYLDFDEEIRETVQAFNSDNGAYYLFVKPQQVTGMRQNILIKSNDKSKYEIKNIILDQYINMSYFTGSFLNNTGHGYRGICKHMYSFKIKDVLETYKNFPSIFE
ncbi:hypothetical protein [Monoglobus pectinilyticus]|uniref:hypothetical protein n=2 Tax=Monoglobus pectinilyticus TaxID=1981510 RepID=UPI00399B66CB